MWVRAFIIIKNASAKIQMLLEVFQTHLHLWKAKYIILVMTASTVLSSFSSWAQDHLSLLQCQVSQTDRVVLCAVLRTMRKRRGSGASKLNVLLYFIKHKGKHQAGLYDIGAYAQKLQVKNKTYAYLHGFFHLNITPCMEQSNELEHSSTL